MTHETYEARFKPVTGKRCTGEYEARNNNIIIITSKEKLEGVHSVYIFFYLVSNTLFDSCYASRSAPKSLDSHGPADTTLKYKSAISGCKVDRFLLVRGLHLDLEEGKND